jgi:hypothetical protein
MPKSYGMRIAYAVIFFTLLVFFIELATKFGT